MRLKFKFRFCDAFWVLELNYLPTKSIKTNSMITALVTKEKWPFQFQWSRTLGVHPPFREGCGSPCTSKNTVQIFSVGIHVFLNYTITACPVIYTPWNPLPLYSSFPKCICLFWHVAVTGQCPVLPQATNLFCYFYLDLYDIGATNHIRRDIQCLPYAGFVRHETIILH